MFGSLTAAAARDLSVAQWHSVGSPAFWIGFFTLVMGVLAIDLGLLSGKRGAVGMTAKKATIMFAVWVLLAFGFNVAIYFFLGRRQAYEFLAGYLLEESLSVDNIFVIILIFRAFKIPGKYQHRVLFWGILGAIVLRAVMILGGTALVQRFAWLNFVFGAFLLITGVRLLFTPDDDEDEAAVKDGFAVRLLKRVIPTADDFDAHRFFTRVRGRLVATPLFIVLLVVEFSDVVFALDSIPAIFGVTTDPFIVFTSNIFAILGLRTLYFLVSGMVDAFRFLKVGLAVILTFVGAKMCAAHYVEVPIGVSLLFIVGVLAIAVVASLLAPKSRG